MIHLMLIQSIVRYTICLPCVCVHLVCKANTTAQYTIRSFEILVVEGAHFDMLKIDLCR